MKEKSFFFLDLTQKEKYSIISSLMTEKVKKRTLTYVKKRLIQRDEM